MWLCEKSRGEYMYRGDSRLIVGFQCFFATNPPYSNLVATVMRCEVTAKIEVWSEIERAIRRASALEKYASPGVNLKRDAKSCALVS